MSNLTTAIMIAAEAHEGQLDKGGQPYILHPLRVMMAQDNETARIVAALHDVAEDYEHGWERIHDGGFSPAILDAIDALTRRKGESYEAFIDRVSENPLARQVKLADIADNLAPHRLSALTDKHVQRYSRARAILTIAA